MMMHSFNSYSWWSPGAMGFGPLGILGMIVLLAVLAVEIALKGFALWYAAKRGQPWWFVAMLVINTAGILEIIYLVFFVHKLHTRVGKKSHGHEDHH